MYLKIPTLAPYPHQKEFIKAVIDGKNVCSCVHRRAGKDIISVQCWLLRALTRVGTHLYLFPLQTQARQVVWKGMDFSGKPFISAIPEALIVRKDNARMELELINGSRMVLGGSNNIDGVVGTNPVTIIYSEFSLHDPMARQYLNPILVQNKGLEILQFTPRGMNHAFELFENVRDNPNYLVQHLSVKETFKADGVTHIITPEQIEYARKMGMSEEMVRQEFMVDFAVGNVGAYFTRELSDMDREGRITILRPNPNLPLHTAWDLGGTDATACWIFQVEGQYINLLHFIHSSGQGLKWYLEQAEMIRKSFQCGWGNHFMPHDVDQKHQGFEQVESRLTAARRHGWQFQLTPKVNLEDGIESMRFAFPYLRIDKVNCAQGLRAIREYQRSYDDKRACFSPKPLDNWATHPADALRYLCVNYRRLYAIPIPQMKYKTGM